VRGNETNLAVFPIGIFEINSNSGFAETMPALFPCSKVVQGEE